MSKRAEEAIAVFHNQALLEAHKYAQPYGGGFSLEIAHGRGLKTGFIQGYEQAEKDTIERAIKWLIDRIDIPCSVVTNENGEPLADSYIDYAKKRFEAANKIVDEFRKAMEEES